MSRADVNAIVVRLLEMYEDRLADPPLGRRYQDCYEMASRRPKAESLAIYSRARSDLAELGLEFRDPPFYGVDS
jgi:methylamine--corrinoid protein Co-methyltransferase